MKESYQRSSKMMTEGAPGISISLVDLCRNKILSYFADERVKIRAYEQYALTQSPPHIHAVLRFHVPLWKIS